jgi:hypothetical protein
MKCAFVMGPGAMLYIPKFYKDWLSRSEVDGGGFTDSIVIA